MIVGPPGWQICGALLGISLPLLTHVAVVGCGSGGASGSTCFRCVGMDGIIARDRDRGHDRRW
jgi:hypothetical protein